MLTEFAKTLGIADGDVEKMREEVKANLEREVKRRIQAKVKERLIEREQALTKHMSDREKQVPPVIAPAPPKAPEPSHRVQKEKQAPLFVDSAVEGTLPPISETYFSMASDAPLRTLRPPGRSTPLMRVCAVNGTKVALSV